MGRLISVADASYVEMKLFDRNISDCKKVKQGRGKKFI
jgi:hypothetical protein